MKNFLKNNILVNLGLLLSIFFVISSIFVFSDYKEFFIGGALLYDNIIFNLSLSYIGGWIIWLLTSIIPAYKDKNKLKKYEKFILNKILNSGKCIFHGIIDFDKDIIKDKDIVKEKCLAFDLYGTLDGIYMIDVNGNFINDYNNFDYLYGNILELNKNIKEFISVYKYIDVNLLAILTNILEARLLNNEIKLKFYKNKKTKNTNLEHFEDELYNLYLILKELENYISNNK